MAMPEGVSIPTDGGQPSEAMKSLVPEGAIIPQESVPAETQVNQADLDAAAKARGNLIEMFG